MVTCQSAWPSCCNAPQTPAVARRGRRPPQPAQPPSQPAVARQRQPQPQPQRPHPHPPRTSQPPAQRTPRPRATPSSAPSGDARRAAPRPGAGDRDSSHGRRGCPKQPRAPGQRPPAEQTARTYGQRQHTRQRSPSARPRQAALQQRKCAAAEPQAHRPQAHPRARRRRPQPRPRRSRRRRRYRRHRRAQRQQRTSQTRRQQAVQAPLRRGEAETRSATPPTERTGPPRARRAPRARQLGTGARVRGAPLQRVGQDHVDVIVVVAAVAAPEAGRLSHRLRKGRQPPAGPRARPCTRHGTGALRAAPAF